jgi:hypothetical protein
MDDSAIAQHSLDMLTSFNARLKSIAIELDGANKNHDLDRITSAIRATQELSADFARQIPAVQGVLDNHSTGAESTAATQQAAALAGAGVLRTGAFLDGGHNVNTEDRTTTSAAATTGATIPTIVIHGGVSQPLPTGTAQPIGDGAPKTGPDADPAAGEHSV